MAKDRPLVDRSVFALAEHWMQDYEVIGDTEDMTWELAAEIQNAVESFIEDHHAQLRER